MKRLSMIAVLAGVFFLANCGAEAGGSFMVASPVGFSGMGGMGGFISHGFGRVSYGGGFSGGGMGRGVYSYSYPYSGYGGFGRTRATVAWQPIVAVPATPVAFTSYDFGTSFGPGQPSEIVSSGTGSSIANAAMTAGAVPGPGQAPATGANAVVSPPAGLFQQGVLPEIASDPHLHRLFRWSEGHVLMVAEDAGAAVLNGAGGSGDAFEAPVVERVKQVLAKLGYDPGAMDGSVGPGLHKAIGDYQADHKLAVTGGLDARLLQSLGMLGNASVIDDSTPPEGGQ